jgi:hypothetical protein
MRAKPNSLKNLLTDSGLSFTNDSGTAMCSNGISLMACKTADFGSRTNGPAGDEDEGGALEGEKRIHCLTHRMNERKKWSETPTRFSLTQQPILLEYIFQIRLRGTNFNKCHVLISENPKPKFEMNVDSKR